MPAQTPAGYPQPQGAYAPHGAHAQPQAVYAQSTAPGLAPAGIHPPGAYVPYGYTPPSGRTFWSLLFLWFIPWVGLVVVPIVMLVQRSRTKQSPLPIVRENARWAANWALSYTLYSIVLILLIIVIAVPTAASSYSGDPSGVTVIPFLLLVAVGVYCLVTMIRGTVIADRRVHRPALAIPFFRA
jgi:uncharacterized Tic20 family protein